MAHFYNEGAARLRREMDRRGLEQWQIRDRMGLGNGVVTRWVRGIRAPSLRMAIELRRLYGIPVESWQRARPDPGIDANG